MAVATNGVVITDAIKYVQGEMNHLNKIEKTKMHDVNEDNKIKEKGERSGRRRSLIYYSLSQKQVKDD